MIQAISACPTTIAEILALAERIEKDEMRVDEVVDGLVDPNAEEDADRRRWPRKTRRSRTSSRPRRRRTRKAAAVQSADHAEAEGRRARSASRVIRTLYNKMTRALAKNGPRSRAYLQARDADLRTS